VIALACAACVKPVVVVIPLYTTHLAAHEEMSLQRSLQVLAAHPITLVCPEGLDLSPLDRVPGAAQCRVERFDPGYFRSIDDYNRLMLSAGFYERFSAYGQLLICQTDVFVFADRLAHWVSRDYDYIGAPWIASGRRAWSAAALRISNWVRRRKKTDEHHFKVGNGGFSLRKVSTMLRIVREQAHDIQHLLAHPDDTRHHVEDVYFSLVAPLKMPEIRIPGHVEAVDFCIDRKPHIALRINGNRLPFACHGFDKPKVRDFWRPVIESALHQPPGLAAQRAVQ
jgi:hypothetical protein